MQIHTYRFSLSLALVIYVDLLLCSSRSKNEAMKLPQVDDLPIVFYGLLQ